MNDIGLPKKRRRYRSYGTMTVLFSFVAGALLATLNTSLGVLSFDRVPKKESDVHEESASIPLTQTIRVMPVWSEATVVFIHIPKAGGGSLMNFWDENFRKGGCALLPPVNAAIGMNDQFREERGLDDGEEPCTHLNTIGVPNLLPKLLSENGIKVRSIFGHVPFGMCKFMEPPCFYATVLRHPVDRLVSHYYFLKEMRITSALPCNCSTFEKFVDAIEKGDIFEIDDQFPYWFDNIQTRMILGDGYMEDVLNLDLCTHKFTGCDRIKFKSITQDDLIKAKENLRKHFSAIGILEDIDEFGEVMVQIHGFSDSYIGHKHKTKTREHPIDDLSKELYDKIAALESWDMQLYEYAKSIRSIAKET